MSKMNLPKNVDESVGFTQDNTTGYSDEELSALNDELSERLGDVEICTDEYYVIAKNFSDEVARR